MSRTGNATRRLMEQVRAAHALECVQRVKSKLPPTGQAKYRGYVERFLTAVLTNGLGQALAFERAQAGANPKGDDEQAHQQLYDNITDWLAKEGDGPALLPAGKDLLEWLVHSSQHEYLAAHSETLAWANWHKKFCQAYLPREQDVSGTSEGRS